VSMSVIIFKALLPAVDFFLADNSRLVLILTDICTVCLLRCVYRSPAGKVTAIEASLNLDNKVFI